MSGLQLNYEETLPPLQSLLAGGVPSLATLETYIADLDVDLEENSKDLDTCLRDLMKLTNNVVGKDYVTPKDALHSMISNHVLEKDSCYDPEPDAITDILSHASDMLENIPGCEEAVLEDLLSLSSKQGLSLPLKATVVDPIASTMSLNAVSDNSEMQIAQKWDNIALHLRRYFYDKLAHLTLTSGPVEVDLNARKRLRYFQSLITLQPVDEVWERYQELRSQQVEKCFNSVITESDTENVDFLIVSQNCRQLAQVIIQMMNEDFALLSSGFLTKTSSLFKAFHKIYLEKYSDEMAALVEEIWDEVKDSVKRGPAQSFCVQGSKGKGKPTSKSGSLLRNQAQSLDSIVSQFDNVGTDVTMTIPTKYIQAILNIVTTVLQIEEHVESLQKASLWDYGDMGSKKTKRKGSLKGVLKPSSSPELKRPSSANMSSVDSEAWMSDTMTSSMNSTTSSMLFDHIPQPKVTVIEKLKLEDKFHWDWKLIFKKVALDLGTGVDQHVRSAMAELLSQEQLQWSETHSLVTVDIRTDLWGGRMDYPKVVSKAVCDFMQELDMFIPLAKAGQDGTLNIVRTAFVDVANLSLKNFHVHMSKICTDVPVHSAVRNLYVILSSAAYIRNYLLHYDTILATDESKRPFSLLYKQFVELVDSLSDLLVQIHKNYIATSVLHDADSTNWPEMKEFYEVGHDTRKPVFGVSNQDERCSFPVQMWNYYLRGVQYDMWTICPPKLSQRMFGDILHESLQIFTQRYSKAKPSFRRVHQFRVDIISILFCVSEMLYNCSSSISQCMDASFSQEPHHSIHNLCTSLLAAMTVITSPLETIYKINKKGYRYRKKRKHEQQAAVGEVVSRGKNTRWLSWIQSTIVQKGFKSYEDMRTTTAIYLHTKLLLCQPEISFPLTLEAYLMKDFTLSILFLTQTLTKPEAQSTTVDNQSTTKKQTSVCREFAESLLRVLMHCGHFPDSLVKVLLPVIDRCQDWQCFDGKHVPGKDIAVPIWMECLFLFMKPLAFRVLKPVIEFVMSVPEGHAEITPISSLIEELPCGCRSQPATPATPRSTQSDGGREMVDVVLHLVVNQLSEDIFVLPSPLCVLFKSLQENCASRGVKTPHSCAGIKLIGLVLRHYLANPHLMEVAVGTNFDQTVAENFVMLADCVYHVLVSGKVKGSSTPRLAGKFCRENREWMNDKIQVPIHYLNSEMFEATESPMLVEATTEFQDQMYNVLACDILATPSGVQDLHRLYWMIYNNQDWLQEQLDIKQVLPLAKQSTSPANFVVDFMSKPVHKFNPVVENQMIGPCSFDHTAIGNIQLDWEKLLQSDLGLSDLGFRSLLYNRQEMQDGAYLEDKEKKPVATLRAVFENEPRELG